MILIYFIESNGNIMSYSCNTLSQIYSAKYEYDPNLLLKTNIWINY